MQCRIDGIELKPVCIIQLANALELVSRAYTPQAAFHVEEDTAALHRNREGVLRGKADLPIPFLSLLAKNDAKSVLGLSACMKMQAIQDVPSKSLLRKE